MLGLGLAGVVGTVLATSPWWRNAWVRAVTSYDVAVLEYEERVAQGLQPSTPGVNLFNMHQQEMLLIFANLGYFVACFLLYLWMSRPTQKAFPLRRTLTCYNLINVLISSFISFSILRYKLSSDEKGFVCNKGKPGDPGLAYVFVVFFLHKLFEFADTIFFILRKSFRQVTFLHLLHHSSITVIVGSLIPFDYNGDMFLPILTNSLVHVAVYMHYLLTCIGVQSWWAPYLTSLQMGQFALIFTHSLLAYIKGPQCGSPDFSKLLLVVYMGSMSVLFGDFFVKRYILHQPAYDMCGVIKSTEYLGGQTTTSFHGNVRLDVLGNATVRMPRSFETNAVAQVMYCYQLTAVGGPMPELHVYKELARLATPGGGYAFVIAGGRPTGMVSWSVCCIRGDDKIRMH